MKRKPKCGVRCSKGSGVCPRCCGRDTVIFLPKPKGFTLLRPEVNKPPVSHDRKWCERCLLWLSSIGSEYERSENGQSA